MGNVQKGKNVNGSMYQECVVINNTAIDELKQKLMANDIEGAMDLIGMQTKFIGTQHPMYPNYSIGLKEKNGQWIPFSKPLTKKAIQDMPPKLTGKFKFSDRYSKFNSVKEIFDYSYQTQTDIDIDVIELKRMLGSNEDPFQNDIESMLNGSGGEWKILHKEFPPAKPFKIFVDDSNVVFDYILLRTTGIDNSVVTLSNKEQDIDITFEFMFDLKTSSMKINVSVDDKGRANYKSQIDYLRFIKSAGNQRMLHIYSLEEGQDLGSGIFDEFHYKSPLGDIDHEIEFLECVIAIEEKFDTKIVLPEEFESSSYENILYLGEGIRKGKIEGTWNNLNTELVIIEGSHNYLKDVSDEPERLTFENQKVIKIFGNDFEVKKTITHFLEAKFVDSEKMKKKLEVLEIGDSIKVRMVPGENDKYIEEFIFD